MASAYAKDTVAKMAKYSNGYVMLVAMVVGIAGKELSQRARHQRVNEHREAHHDGASGFVGIGGKIRQPVGPAFLKICAGFRVAVFRSFVSLLQDFVADASFLPFWVFDLLQTGRRAAGTITVLASTVLSQSNFSK